MQANRVSFDEFFSAFSKSVRVEVELLDTDLVISSTGSLLNEALVANASPTHSTSRPASRAQSQLPRLRERQPQPSQQTPSDSKQARNDIPLPVHIEALVRLQYPDGSWRFDDKFSFSINGVAAPPPDGISPKLWATAVAVIICRQVPEYFVQLESTYEKAMLHVDDNILKLAHDHIDLTAIDQIRPYQNNEAKEIRDRLAKEAAAKRAEEDAEAHRIELERQTAKMISNFSVVKAKRLPLSTQDLFISSLTTNVESIFPSFKPPPPQLKPREMDVKVGDIVECCWRRVDGSTKPRVRSQWWPGKVTAIALDGKSLHIQYLDDPFEKQRDVLFKYVRLVQDDARHRRSLAFDSLKATWEVPVPLSDELNRLQQIESLRKWRKPWEVRSLPALPVHQPIVDSTEEDEKLVYHHHRSIRKPSNISQLNPTVESQFRVALAATLAYDKLYTRARGMVKKASLAYKNAMLFRERFDAFSEFLQFAVELVQATVIAVEEIERWYLQDNSTETIRMFMWKGSDFIITSLHALNFLGTSKAAVEWYGDDFPFTCNPFLRAESIRDLAHDRGLLFTSKAGPIPPEHQLRVTLRMHKDTVSEVQEISTWWPESHYSEGLRERIRSAESVRRSIWTIEE